MSIIQWKLAYICLLISIEMGVIASNAISTSELYKQKPFLHGNFSQFNGVGWKYLTSGCFKFAKKRWMKSQFLVYHLISCFEGVPNI